MRDNGHEGPTGRRRLLTAIGALGALLISTAAAGVLGVAVAQIALLLAAVTGVTAVGEMSTDDAFTVLVAVGALAASGFSYYAHRLPLRLFVAHPSLVTRVGLFLSLVSLFAAIRFFVCAIEQQHERLPSPSARSFWIALVLTATVAMVTYWQRKRGRSNAQ